MDSPFDVIVKYLDIDPKNTFAENLGEFERGLQLGAMFADEWDRREDERMGMTTIPGESLV